MKSSTISNGYLLRESDGDCQRVQDLLSDYIDSILDSRSLALVEAHTAHCDSCRRDLRQLGQTVTGLRSLPPLDPPAYFIHAVQARISQNSRPSKTPLLEWINPGRQGMAIRLAATALILMALLPPVRKPVINGTLSLLGDVGIAPAAVEKTTPRASIETPSMPIPSPPVLPTSISASTAGATTAQADSGTGNGVPAPGIETNPVLIPQPTLPAPVPLSRPAASDVFVQFKAEGTARPGGIMMVTAAVTSRRDWTGSAVEANLSPGAHFVADNGTSMGTRQQLGPANLAENMPWTSPMMVSTDQPGVFDLRVNVITQGGSASSDVLLPVGKLPSPLSIDTTSTGPTDLYTALTTLAAQSGRRIAVESGLSGTVSLDLHPASFEEAISKITERFGCGWYEENGIYHVVLHPEKPGKLFNRLQ